MKGKIRVRVVLMKCGGRRVEDDAGQPRAAVVLDLRSVEEQEADHVFLVSLPVQFDRRIFQLRAIDEGAGAAHEPNVLRRI